MCGSTNDHHLFHLCTVPLSLDSEPSAVVIPHTVGPSPARLNGKMVPSFHCHIPIVYPIHNVHECVSVVFIVVYLLRVHDSMYAF